MVTELSTTQIALLEAIKASLFGTEPNYPADTDWDEVVKDKIMHAYLIIAHKNFNQLAQLLSLLDDKRNDIYIHIDKKSPFSEKDKKLLNCSVNHSKVYFVHRITVTWGAYSNVESEMILLKAAVKKGYDYYHLISGQDLPLKTQDEIHSFFDSNKGKEFVHFGTEEYQKSQIYRIKYYWFFREGSGRSTSIDKRILKGISKILVSAQKLIGIDRTKKQGLRFKFAAGAQWFSITNSFANYIVQNEDRVNKMLKHTVLCDEVLVQTLAVNSVFYNNCYHEDFDDNYHSIMRNIDWKRGSPYTWQKNDYDELIRSDFLFARKFDSDVDGIIINKICDHLNK